MIELLCSPRQQMEQRHSLIQRLGLESEYLHSCLVKSEAALLERDCQKALYLVRGRAEDQYRSVLDYLLGLFMPSIKPAIFSFYRDGGPRLLDVVPFARIAVVDDALEHRVRELALIYQELRGLSWELDVDFRLLINTYLDFDARPQFPQIGVRIFQSGLASDGGAAQTEGLAS